MKLTLSIFIGSAMLLHASFALAGLTATGYAKYTELSEELFLTSISVDENHLSNDIQTIKENAKRLEFKFLKKLSHRRFNRLLMQNAAANSPVSSLNKNAGSFALFSQKIKGSFERGDHLVLQKNTQHELTYSLNNVELGTISSPEFFDILLNIWIGPFPPSRELKERIIGTTDYSEYQTDFNSLSFNRERKNAIVHWSEPSQQEQTTPIKTASPIETVKTVAKTNQTASNSRPFTTHNTKIITKKIAREATKNKTTERQDTSDENNPKQTIATGQHETENTIVAVDNTIPQAHLNHVIDDYATLLALHAKKKITYPKRAMQLGHTGNIVAKVTIDRQGKVLTIDYPAKAKFSSLNNAVKKAIKKSQPYPNVPDMIKGQRFSFLVPVTFALQG